MLRAIGHSRVRVLTSGARVLVLVSLVLSGCREGPAAPAEPHVSLSVVGDDVIFAAVGALLSDELQVAAVDAGSGSPARGVRVEWKLVDGSASFTNPTSDTDTYGLAATALRLEAAGSHRVTASAARMTGAAPQFEVRVVPVPLIQSVAPAVLTAGGEVVITGSNFSTRAADNAVYFDGLRGQVLAATATELRVTVPPCLPARTAVIQAGLGSVISNPHLAPTTGVAGSLLTLAPGEVRTLTQPSDFSCVRLDGGQPGASYLLVVHNAAHALGAPAKFELRALTPRPPTAAQIVTETHAPPDFAAEWERRLRLDERRFAQPGIGPDLLESPLVGQARLPVLGERRDFNVLDRENRFGKVTAAVRAVTSRAIIYVDLEAESVLSAQDIAHYGAVFDDPIHSAVTGVFGTPSDIDGNDRVLILFTPRVNQLTPRNENSFVAGFFYGCDLVSRSRCSGSNQAEVFYAIVPDPTGRWADARSQTAVRSAVPPVLAHEFQHMIHFAQRGFSSDVLWLSEGLAHTAEEIVGNVFTAHNAPAQAAAFLSANLLRAQRYLSATASTSLLTEEPPGTLEARGAAWLFLKYLQGQHGGHDLLRRLTQTTRSGVANVTEATGQPWATLVSNFGVALWADGAPQIPPGLDSRYQFPGFDLRASLSSVPGSFPLSPSVLQWRDFTASGSIVSSAQTYYTLVSPGDGSALPLNVVLTGTRGAPFATEANARLSILRVR